MLTNLFAAAMLGLTYDYGLIELFVLLALFWSCRYGWFKRPPFGRLENALAALSRRRLMPYLVLLLVSLGVRWALLPVQPIPEPYVPDEFSHQLLADTLSHGRLSNPTHPLWKHFESIHIFHQPTYSSMYLPGQALYLLTGKVLLGHFWYGVWLSNGLLACAIFWMLCGWFPRRWAFAGALIACLRFCIPSYWVNSYWGGTPGAIGGALVLGAVIRLRKKLTVHAAALGSLGVLLLAISRPYEGAVLVFGAACYLLVGVARSGWTKVASLSKHLAVSIAILLCGGFAICDYCRAVTGDAFKLPYVHNRELYGWPLTLAWITPHDMPLRHKEIHDYLIWEMREHEQVASLSSFVRTLPLRLGTMWRFYFGFSLTVLLLFAKRVLLDRRTRPLLLLTALIAVALLAEQSWYPHYFAVAAPGLLALMLQALRHLRTAGRRGSRIGVQLSRAMFVPMPLLILLQAAHVPPLRPSLQPFNRCSWLSVTDRGAARSRVLVRLNSVPGGHVVFVRYDRDSYNTFEWVYNSAEINSAKVIWARDMGSANEQVRSYYPDRQFWLVEPDVVPVRLQPYVSARIPDLAGALPSALPGPLQLVIR